MLAVTADDSEPMGIEIVRIIECHGHIQIELYIWPVAFIC